jgi:hypothetical protein
VVDFDPGSGVFTLTPASSMMDMFMLKLDANGFFVWAIRLGGQNEEVAFGIKTDSDNNVIVSGGFTDTVDFDPGAGTSIHIAQQSNKDMFILKLDSSGNYIWVQTYGGPGPLSDIAMAVHVDTGGFIYFTGQYSGTIDFDPGPGIANLTAVGFADLFTCKLDPTGNFIWVGGAGGPSNEPGMSLCSDLAGNVFVTGLFFDSVDFDPGPGMLVLTANGGQRDAFILKYLPDPTGITEDGPRQNTSIYPNPSNGILSIQLGTLKDAEITVFDAIGKIIHRASSVNDEIYSVDLGETSGPYLVEIASGNQRLIHKVVR